VGQAIPGDQQALGDAWSEFIPFLDYDVEIRRVICSTNAIESINARYRRAVRTRGHFLNDTAALKCLYLLTRAPRPHRTRQSTLGDEMEARSERVRDSVRRKNQIKPPSTSTVNLTLPRWAQASRTRRPARFLARLP